MAQFSHVYLLFPTTQVGFIYQSISSTFLQGRLAIDSGNLKRHDRQVLPKIPLDVQRMPPS